MTAGSASTGVSENKFGISSSSSSSYSDSAVDIR
eukprot:CAMPEP_0171022162 /NCGR_PEP_ID=MMETSP0736-20130129/31210_1 /TAXON_ID=186038 /ORGANISM="Fragilariopsis kerguelensis, Strain L26-C5" /LENGTH=33 /DNA_ID= /DNA_START= /DNA_END= /DNA_ORIENTATION=